MWVKICGVTRAEDAVMVAQSGASAIGLNFYPESRRYVTLSIAQEIASEVAEKLELIGVFVNSPVVDIDRIVDQLMLSGVQFHGDESPETIAAFHRRHPQIRIIKALRVTDSAETEIAGFVQAMRFCGVNPSAILVDADVPGIYGGSGQRVDDRALEGLDRHQCPPLILAGGLNAENVVEVIQSVQPWGVDVASGVESSAGIKDHHKVQSFIRAVQSVSNS